MLERFRSSLTGKQFVRRPSHPFRFRPRLEGLDERVVPTGSPSSAVGAAPGGEPWIWEYDSQGDEVNSFLAFESTFTGGVRTAMADLNGDGTQDVVAAAGPGGGPRVRVFDGATGATLADFYAYESTFTGGVWVAAGPVGSGQVGIATGADATGGPRVKVFSADGATTLQDFFAYDSTFTGGVRVALGQATGGPTVYATPGDGLDPTLRAFDVSTATMTFEQEAGPAGTTGGTLVAAGDLNADGNDDIFTAVASDGDTELRAFNGADGAYMHHSLVDLPASGLGIVNWEGDRAIGLLGDGVLETYALTTGTEGTALGRVDATDWTNQWGGFGASLSGVPEGGTAGSLGAGSVETLAAYWAGAGDVAVTSTVTKGIPGDPDHYKWEYHVVNDSFSGTYVPPDGITYFNIDTQAADPTQPGGNQIISMDNSRGWTQAIGQFNSDPDSVAWWDENGESNANHILPGQEGYFSFKTLPLPIITGQGQVWSAGVAVTSNGDALVPDTADGDMKEIWDSVIYDRNVTGSLSDDITPNEQDSAFVQNAWPAPTSTTLTMGQVADRLVAIQGSKKGANDELERRKHVISDTNQKVFTDVDLLKSAAVTDKKRFIQRGIVPSNKGDKAFLYFLWGQDVSIPNYNGTLIQKIEITDKVWETGQANPLTKSYVQVEGFFLKNGRTKVDLQRESVDISVAKFTKFEKTVTITLGGGVYNNRGVRGFKILESKHTGNMKGEITWAGATTTLTYKLTLDNAGNVTATGPWGNQ